MSRKAPATSSLPILPLSMFGDAGAPELRGMPALADSDPALGQMWGKEWTKFALHWPGRGRDYPKRLAACRDWSALASLQASWASEAVSDYLARGREPAELVRQRAAEEFGEGIAKDERSGARV